MCLLVSKAPRFCIYKRLKAKPYYGKLDSFCFHLVFIFDFIKMVRNSITREKVCTWNVIKTNTPNASHID